MDRQSPPHKQNPLPKLPLPTLSQTLSKLIETCRPYLSPSELQHFRSLVAAAQNSPDLHERQHRLELLREKTDNWLYETWLQGYMGWSAPLPINSNVACCLVDEHLFRWAEDVPEVAAEMRQVMGEGWQQVLGAALLIHQALSYHVAMLEGRAPFQLEKKAVCSHTYDSMFSSTRIPGDSERGEDHIRGFPEEESKHLAIFSGGRFFSLQVLQSREIIPLPLLFQSLYEIQRDTLHHPSSSSLPSICTLTAQDRRKWGNARRKLLANGPANTLSLSIIESSIFTVALDPLPSSPLFTPEPTTAGDWVKRALAGRNGESNWFDKSFQLSFSSTGQPAQNIEHSWADAPVPLDMFWNFALPSAEKAGKDRAALASLLSGLSQPRLSPEWPKQKEFWFEGECVGRELAEAKEGISAAIRDCDLVVLRCKGLGKQIWKKAKLSPDAACQMAFQLAYRRMTGNERPPATYETIGMTAYRKGRTECCKVVSVPSEEFVRSALDYLESLNKQLPQQELETKRKATEEALRFACNSHLKYISEGQKGRAIDRHLLGLRVMSKDGKQPDLFNHPVFSESGCTGGFMLSTSNNSYIRRHFGAAFGCVVPNGYGLMYVPAQEEFSVTIESKRSCPETNSDHFATWIDRSLRDIARIAGVEVEDSVRVLSSVPSKL